MSSDQSTIQPVKAYERRLFRARKDHLSCDLDGKAVILSLEDGVYFGVNSVGSFIWSVISEEKKFEEIIDSVTREFDVSEEQCRPQVISFLDSLHENGLIDISDEASE